MACPHEEKRQLIRRAVLAGNPLIDEMYERYERERLAGARANPESGADLFWRSVLRQEVDRSKRLGT